ncbi:hypothetical protein ABFA07_023365 [Porites harrisoni]
MLVLTDGNPLRLPKDLIFAEFAKNISRDFQDKGVYIVAVGIGRKINTTTLIQIAGEEQRVVLVKNFQQLQGKIDKIKSSVCSD